MPASPTATSTTCRSRRPAPRTRASRFSPPAGRSAAPRTRPQARAPLAPAPPSGAPCRNGCTGRCCPRLPDDHELRLQRRVDCDDERQDLRRARLEGNNHDIDHAAPPRPISTPKGRSPGPAACRTEPRNTPARRFARSSRRRSTSATSPHPSTTSRRRRSLGARPRRQLPHLEVRAALRTDTFTAQGCTRTGR